jgi:hypothetical protein
MEGAIDRSGGKKWIAAILIKRSFSVHGSSRRNSKKVGEIKTGFYYIALKANVPLIPVAFDFGKKKSI